MVATLVRPGRGNWSPLILRWDERRQVELPTPIELRRNQRVQIMGVEYRVQSVRQEQQS